MRLVFKINHNTVQVGTTVLTKMIELIINELRVCSLYYQIDAFD